MKHSTGSRNRLPVWSILFWLAAWQLGAMLMNEPLLLVTPTKVLIRLTELCRKADFWKSIFFTAGHILAGFLLSALLGVGLGILAWRFGAVRQLLAPLTAAVKAVPVASFVILALLWVSSRDLSILISLLIGFPVLYSGTLAGLDNVDPAMEEMARVFRIPFGKRMQALYLHQLDPFLYSALNVAAGLCWKSGVAAEIIGIPDGSVGEKLYKAKIYLETPDLFCWTLVIVLLSAGTEKLLKVLLDRLREVRDRDPGR